MVLSKRKFHVQIALVGGQPTPVYQGIIHLHPNQVVLVCSENSRKVADDIRRQLPFYDDKDILIYEISDINLEAMYQTAELIEQAMPKGITLSLNLSGGMKLWSIIFNNVFRRKRRSCHSFFIGQNGTFFDLKNKTSGTKVDFDMDAQFKILGHKLDSYTLLSDYSSTDFSVLNVIQQWGFSPKYHFMLKELTECFVESYKKKYGNNLYKNLESVDTKFGHLDWDPATKTFECVLGTKSLKFTSPHVEHIVLNTGWFELYVAKMIAKANPNYEVRLNCVFKTKKNTTKNEVDIIVNTGNKLIFVECKTQIKNTTDVDKFRSVVRNYGGLGSKHLFVTNWEMKPDAKEKCEDFDIATFHFEYAPDNGTEQKPPLYASVQEKSEALAKVLDELNKKWNYK